MIAKPRLASIIKGNIDTHYLNKVVKKQELFEYICLLDGKSKVLFQQK